VYIYRDRERIMTNQPYMCVYIYIYLERVMTNQLHTTSSIYLCSYSCVLCACAIYKIQNSMEMNVTSQ